MAREKARPTYYDFIRALDNQLNEYGMTYSEQLLYHTLLLINNRKHWVDWFHCTDAYLTDFMGIGTTAMKNARNQLKQKDMIDFVTSKQRGTSTKYHVCDEFCTYSINVQTNNKRITNGVQTNNKPDTNKDKRYKNKDLITVTPVVPLAVPQNIIEFYQENISRNYITRIELDNLEFWLTRVDADMLEWAIKEAVVQSTPDDNKRNWKYIEAILNNHFNAGRTTLAAVQASQRSYKAQKNEPASVCGDSGLDDAELEKIMQEKM